MARTMGRGSVPAGGRGVGQDVGQAGGRGIGRGSSQGSHLAATQEVWHCGGRVYMRGGGQAGDQVVGRRSGIGSSQSSGQAGDRGVGRGGGIGNSQSSGQAGDRGVGRGGGIGNSQSSDQAGARGVGRGGGIGNSQNSGQAGDRGVGRADVHSSDRGVGDVDVEYDFNLMNSPIESSAGDDESAFHVAPTRRGSASQAQVPEPINRDWIWVVEGEFSNQGTATRTISSNLISLWSGPWDSWRDVPNEHRTRLFERFQMYYQWEERNHAPIYRCWEKCIAGKFPTLLRNVRKEAKAMAKQQGKNVGDDMTDLIDFKPTWIRSEIWEQMLDHWNTPKWKAKSLRNKEIRSRATGDKHTLGSQSYVTMKRKAERKLGHELTIREAFKQSHCRKGSRPLDKDLTCSNSLLLDVDSEGDAQEENLVWVDARAKETWVKYEGFLEEKYGKERNKHPKFDKDLWSRAEGKNKGKGYGLGNDNDPCVHSREDPEIEKLNLVIKELVKEKDEDKERFNGIIAGLLADKEKDKVDKDALLDRMSQIEAMLTATVRK